MHSHDVRVAHWAVKLKKKYKSAVLLFSGGIGTGPHSGFNLNGWKDPEADIFAEVARKSGVPENEILVENRAKNSGENVTFSQEILMSSKVPSKRLIVVQKPFMERRAYATFKKRWPDPEIIMSSPPVSFQDYPNHHIKRKDVVF